MFNKYVNDDDFTKPADSIYYLYAENGLFKCVNNSFYEATIEKRGDNPLNKCRTAAKMKLPPLPYALFQQVDAFFAAVYKEHDGEAIVLLAASPVDQAWQIVVPEQTTRGLHVDYKVPDTLDLPDHYKIFGSIHSHAGISAFHSGTDTHDERYLDGLHAVIGHYDQPVRDVCACLVVQGKRFELQQHEWLATPPIAPVDANSEWLTRVKKVERIPYEEPTLQRRDSLSDFELDMLTDRLISRASHSSMAADCFESDVQNDTYNEALERLLEDVC